MKPSLRVLCGVALVALVFIASPWLDLAISSGFYDPVRGFWLAQSWPALLVYHGVTYCLWGFSLVLVGTLVWAHVSGHAKAQSWRRPLWFLLWVLALGPGLITNHVFKEFWGRPRPEMLTEFGGTSRYVRPGVISDQCDTNCSFVSGHAAAAFYPIAFAWVFPQRRRRWMLAGIAAGSITGLVRIMQGGHFFSDVFFSFWVVWLTASAVAWVMKPEKPAAATEHS